MPEVTTPRGFYEALYATAPEGTHTHLTFGKRKEDPGDFLVRPTRAFAMPSQADEMMTLARSVTDANVYFTPGIVGPEWSGAGRTVDDDVTALVSLWADFDPLDGEMFDPDAVLTMLSERFALPVSAVVNSGHGLQVHWFLDEPIEGDGMKPLLDRMKATMVRIGMEAGIPPDKKVFHPGRLLRVPGTLNVNGEPAPTSMREVPRG